MGKGEETKGTLKGAKMTRVPPKRGGVKARIFKLFRRKLMAMLLLCSCKEGKGGSCCSSKAIQPL